MMVGVSRDCTVKQKTSYYHFFLHIFVKKGVQVYYQQTDTHILYVNAPNFFIGGVEIIFCSRNFVKVPPT